MSLVKVVIIIVDSVVIINRNIKLIFLYRFVSIIPPIGSKKPGIDVIRNNF